MVLPFEKPDAAVPTALLLTEDFMHGALVKSALSTLGIQACMAITEAEASDVLNSLSPDLILADWDADIDGRNFLQSVRRLSPELIRVPAILMAADLKEDPAAGSALRDGYLWVLKKPFAMVKLLYVLRMALAQSPRKESVRMHAGAMRQSSGMFRLFDPIEYEQP